MMQVAMNQAAIGLQEARHLREQKLAREELERGVGERTAELAALNARHVCKTEAVYPPHVHSAFPLITLPKEDYA